MSNKRASEGKNNLKFKRITQNALIVFFMSDGFELAGNDLRFLCFHHNALSD